MRERTRRLHSLLIHRARAGLVLWRVRSLWGSNPATAGRRGSEAQIRRAISSESEPVRSALAAVPSAPKRSLERRLVDGVGLAQQWSPRPSLSGASSRVCQLDALPLITQVK
nr:uncharacterized protein LOC104650755 [Saimiri boliviensis boliviensis]